MAPDRSKAGGNRNRPDVLTDPRAIQRVHLDHHQISSHQNVVKTIQDTPITDLKDVEVDKTSDDFAAGQSLVWGGDSWIAGDPEVLIPVKAAEEMSKGTPVYVSDEHASGKPIVSKADSDGTDTYPAIGLLFTDLASGEEGHAVGGGIISGLDTTAYTGSPGVGDPLYISSTAGVLTGTRPTATNEKVQKVAVIARLHGSAGSVIVMGAGRTNDVPNELTALTGVPLGDSDLGTFTGTTIADNETIKGALQDLETAVESAGGGGDPDWKVTTYSSQDYVVLDAADSSSTQTDVPVVVQPKGTGAFMLNEPDGTATGGNPRGQYAVDLVLKRSSNSEVAGGNYSVAMGYRARALGNNSIAIGSRANNSNPNATGSTLIGNSVEVGGSRGDSCVSIGNNLASYWDQSVQVGNLMSIYEITDGFGSSRPRATTNLGNQGHIMQPGGICINSGQFLSGTNRQRSVPVTYVERAETTDASATKMFFRYAGDNTYGMQTQDDCLHQANLMISALSDGGEWATFERHVVATRGSGYATTVLESATTIGTDLGSNSGSPPTGWSISIAVQTANVQGKGNVYVTVTGAASTNVRWVCNWDSLQLQYDAAGG